jgi:dienelactone hydrolase
MSVQLHQLQVESEAGLPIRVDLRCRAEWAPLGGIVVCHGFKGFKDWGFFPHVSQRLAEAGYAVATVDFSHNGIGDQPGEFTRLDLFAQNNFSRELRDFEFVRSWLFERSPLAVDLDGKPCGVLAHSRAALTALVAAAENPAIAAVVSWNGLSKAIRFTDRQLEQWEQDGELEFTNARTGQRMSIDWQFIVDCMENRERFDLAAQVKRMRAAHLILHGSEDMAVDPTEAEELRAGRGPDEGCELRIIAGGSHTFGAVHPFAGSTEQLDEAIELSVQWFGRHLHE